MVKIVTPEELRRIEVCHNIVKNMRDKDLDIEYGQDEAFVIARFMNEIADRVHEESALSFAQQFLLNQGLKEFGEKGKEAADKELHQLYDRECFELISIKEMSLSEQAKA